MLKLTVNGVAHEVERRGRAVGGRVHVFAELPSTNDVAAGLPPGEAAVALYQTRGRGQYGRAWASRPEASLLLSVAAVPRDRRPVALTAWAAEAGVELA